jgi:hypothetical protein
MPKNTDNQGNSKQQMLGLQDIPLEIIQKILENAGAHPEGNLKNLRLISKNMRDNVDTIIRCYKAKFKQAPIKTLKEIEEQYSKNNPIYLGLLKPYYKKFLDATTHISTYPLFDANWPTNDQQIATLNTISIRC